MLRKIIKSELQHTHMQYVYYLHDEEGEFGFVALHRDYKPGIIFKETEEVRLDTTTMGLIFEFMDRLQKIINNDELDTLRDEYYYNETGQTQSTNSPSKQ